MEMDKPRARRFRHHVMVIRVKWPAALVRYTRTTKFWPSLAAPGKSSVAEKRLLAEPEEEKHEGTGKRSCISLLCFWDWIVSYFFFGLWDLGRKREFLCYSICMKSLHY